MKMMRRQKYSWSYNELFAHKKNTGEEAKLRDRMYRLDQKFGLVKDSIRHETLQVRTSLRNLRRSTGHSMAALPPTPFQMKDRQRHDSFLFLDKYKREDTFPTLDQDGREDTFLSTQFTVEPQPKSINTDCDYSTTVGTDTRNNIHCRSDAQLNSTDGENISDQIQVEQATVTERLSENGILTSHAVSLQYKTDNKCPGNKTPEAVLRTSPRVERVRSPLPQIETFVNLVNAKQGQNYNITQCDVKTQSLPNQDKAINRKQSTIQETQLSPLTQNRRNDSSGFNSGTELLGETEGLIKQNTTQLSSFRDSANISKSSRSMNKQIRKRNSITTDTNPCLGVVNTDNSVVPQTSRPRQMTTKKASSSNDPKRPMVMRNTRYRCRTCLERFRQNLEFERRDQDENDSPERKSGLVTRKQLNPTDNKSFLINDHELNSLFSETEVLDFKESKRINGQHEIWNGSGAKTGFSKARLEQLAEPKKGRSKRLLFSKHLIKKEVDSLTEKHSHPQLTEKEKERQRVMESKIRMFLAMTLASGDVMPSSMVHIPQREDVMTVDISHL